MVKKTHYLYILKNEFMPEVVKVGWSARNPSRRADELGSATGVPGKFELVQAFAVRDGLEAEGMVYNALSNFRILKKEFIRIPPDEAKKIIRIMLSNAGVMLGAEENSFYGLASYLLQLVDALNNGEKKAKEPNEVRMQEFMAHFFATEKIKSEEKLANYFWNETREMEMGNLTENDILVIYYLKASGFEAHFESLCSHYKFDRNKIDGTVFEYWIVKFIKIAKAGLNNKWHEKLFLTTRSLTTYREYYEKMTKSLQTSMIELGIDWVPIRLDHDVIDFTKVNLGMIKNGNILYGFGFKSGTIRNEIAEGQTTQFPNGKNKHYCIFNGVKYEVDWTDRAKIDNNVFAKDKDWVYEWNESRLKRCICIVISQGKVLHVAGRESISPLTGSTIKVVGR